MKTKRTLLGFLVLTLLACNYVTQMVLPATATAIPTITPTATPLAPAYIPPQCDAAAPLATIAPDVAIQPTPVFETKQISKLEQLQVLNEIDYIVGQVYIYPDYNGRDWNAIVSKYRNKIRAGIDTDTFYNEMQSMIDELGDDHSTFIPPVDVQMTEAELKGEREFVGVGIYSDVDFERGSLVILSTFPDSPAELGGVRPHDSVLLVCCFPH